MLVRVEQHANWRNFLPVVALAVLVTAIMPMPMRGWQESAVLSNHADFDSLPLSFEPNAGQSDPEVRFVAHASGGTLYFTPSQVTLALDPGPAQPPNAEIQNSTFKTQHSSPGVVRLSFVGANASAALTGDATLPGKVNYFVGNDPRQWRTGLPTYGNINYRGLYPGIDLTYAGSAGSLKGTYTIAPRRRAYRHTLAIRRVQASIRGRARQPAYRSSKFKVQS